MKYCILSVVLFWLSSNAIAHQDRIIKVSENGDLKGLPEKYLPANINLKKKRTSIAGNEFSNYKLVSKWRMSFLMSVRFILYSIYDVH